jgi:hypothetical protein
MKNLLRALGSSSLAAVLAVGASADTIYMKNGSVIRGHVVGYADGEFTVMLNAGPSGSRSRATLAGDEIDHIEFEGEAADTARNGSAPASLPTPDGSGSGPDTAGTVPDDPSAPVSSAPDPAPHHDASSAPVSDTGRSVGGGLDAGESDVTVDPRADWTNTRFRVSRGSRVRITATGSVKLDPAGRRTAGPGGIEAPDRDKLMPNRPTGALIAVIGDDNDDFVYVGSQVEFTADRAGYLFLSVNEGYLKDNSGSFIAHVVVEPAGAMPVARTGGGMHGSPPASAPTPARHTTIPPADSGAPRSIPSAPARREEPSTPPASVESDPAGTGTATVSREGDVVVQSNLDWTNTKMRVQRGNIIRIHATGTVQLGPGSRSGPAGIDAPDNDKLLPNRPTGALIAVVGDDNDDFVFVGPEAEFIAQHDGALFLSVNEGNLKDNTGTFSAHVTILQPQVVAPSSTAAPGSARTSAPSPRGGASLPKPVVDDTLGGGTPTAQAPRPAPASIGANGGQADIVVPAKSDWTSTSIVLKRGTKVRVTATGTAKLDASGKTITTPAGVNTSDANKLIKDKPTGALVAVIGDDNTDYIFVGTSIEFTAQRDGLLFLGINEGELFDNSGAFTVHIVVEPARKH